ncbi:hypothetical protein CQY20_09190 [Mycolicibacterium agri]|uniref:Uncharacterized protein n=1 Tax=Mycolicibacterium agri TaxID=36811 RepID=A0A2A7N7L0_MYCAG|nr:hypothetical protein [Mycolicibacterium agri]PEG39717.1 hypothetical protein CQY20_09190 [Mycolicibacterium agri]GFG52576.1 hypothetical protein MAGR_40170 [Mycolicibacterium agri]
MPFAKSSLSIKLQNFPPANRDAVVTLTNPLTGQTLERKPFLDGTLLVRDLDPGQWQIAVKHPNVVGPLYTGVVTTLPVPLPTYVPVPIRPEDFLDTPIQDVPDADLGPVQQTVSAARTTASAVGGKAPGEAIRATDWNQLVSAVSDVATAVLELTSLVSPRGHDHPEIATKIDEVQGNLRRFIESFGNSVLELRRDIESQNLRRLAVKVLDAGGVVGADRDRILQRVDDLEVARQVSTVEYSTKLADAGTVLAAEVQNIAQAQGANAPVFLDNPDVKTMVGITQAFAASAGTLSADQELDTYRRTSLVQRTSKFGGI